MIAYNSEELVKDVTRRYCPHWLSVTRKQRIDEKWWIETINYWSERETAISKQEDELLLQKYAFFFLLCFKFLIVYNLYHLQKNSGQNVICERKLIIN